MVVVECWMGGGSGGDGCAGGCAINASTSVNGSTISPD